MLFFKHHRLGQYKQAKLQLTLFHELQQLIKKHWKTKKEGMYINSMLIGEKNVTDLRKTFSCQN